MIGKLLVEHHLVKWSAAHSAVSCGPGGCKPSLGPELGHEISGQVVVVFVVEEVIIAFVSRR